MTLKMTCYVQVLHIYFIINVRHLSGDCCFKKRVLKTFTVTWIIKCVQCTLACCSVTKPGLTLCSSMDCSMPGSCVLHLTEFAQIHAH